MKNIYKIIFNKVFRSFELEDIQKFNFERLEHLRSLNLPWQSKTVMEIGSGPGMLTRDIIDLVRNNGQVISVDGRSELLLELRKKFPNVKTIQYDLDSQDWQSSLPKVDIIFCYGLLYHLSEPTNALRNIATLTKDFAVIETVVARDILPEGTNRVKENPRALTTAMNGIGTRPSRSLIWKEAQNNFKYVYMPKTQPNHPYFPKDYKEKYFHTQRMVIICSHVEINNNLLHNKLIDSFSH